MYKISIAGLNYVFKDKDQIYDYIDVNLAFSENRKEFYTALFLDSSSAIVDLIEKEDSDKAIILVEMVGALRIIAEKYGPIYDADKTLFKADDGSQEMVNI